MKATFLIPPAAVLVLVGGWNISQMRAISVLEGEQRLLQKQIEVASAARLAGENNLAKKYVETNASGENKRINWGDLAATITGANRGDCLKDQLDLMRFQKRLGEMTKEEMVAALDEIAGSGLAGVGRANLSSMIMDSLIAKDPELALLHFGSQIRSDPDGLGWQLSTALKQWARIDLAAATTWLDQNLASGTFDSKTLDARSTTHIRFESALIECMLANDPKAAAQRVAVMPNDSRREILQSISFGQLNTETRAAYTDLVKDLMPQDERDRSFAHIASHLVSHEGNFSEASTFLDRVQATPQERTTAAIDAVNSRMEQLTVKGTIGAQDVDAMREWLKLQAPDRADSITGQALGEATQECGEFKFSNAAELALKYHKSGGNDDLLVSFLKTRPAGFNLEEAQSLAGWIKDPATRESMLNTLK